MDGVTEVEVKIDASFAVCPSPKHPGAVGPHIRLILVPLIGTLTPQDEVFIASGNVKGSNSASIPPLRPQITISLKTRFGIECDREETLIWGNNICSGGDWEGEMGQTLVADPKGTLQSCTSCRECPRAFPCHFCVSQSPVLVLCHG